MGTRVFFQCLFLKRPLWPSVIFRSGERPSSALLTVLYLPCIPTRAFVAMATPGTTSTQTYKGLYIHWHKFSEEHERKEK